MLIHLRAKHVDDVPNLVRGSLHDAGDGVEGPRDVVQGALGKTGGDDAVEFHGGLVRKSDTALVVLLPALRGAARP